MKKDVFLVYDLSTNELIAICDDDEQASSYASDQFEYEVLWLQIDCFKTCFNCLETIISLN